MCRWTLTAQKDGIDIGQYQLMIKKERCQIVNGDNYLCPCKCICPVRSWSMPINTHIARLDMKWKYLTMRTETGCQTKTELLFKTWSTQDDPSKAVSSSRLQKSQGRIVLKTLAMEEKSKDYRIVLGCVLQYVRGSQGPGPGKEGLPL